MGNSWKVLVTRSLVTYGQAFFTRSGVDFQRYTILHCMAQSCSGAWGACIMILSLELATNSIYSYPPFIPPQGLLDHKLQDCLHDSLGQLQSPFLFWIQRWVPEQERARRMVWNVKTLRLTSAVPPSSKQEVQDITFYFGDDVWLLDPWKHYRCDRLLIFSGFIFNPLELMYVLLVSSMLATSCSSGPNNSVIDVINQCDTLRMFSWSRSLWTKRGLRVKLLMYIIFMEMWTTSDCFD